MQSQENTPFNDVFLPPDVMHVIISLIPELKQTELSALRSVSRDFKRSIDSLLTKPLNVVNLMGELNKTQANIFLNYYANTDDCKRLIQKNDDLLSPLEKICVSCVTYKGGNNKSATLEEMLTKNLAGISEFDALKLVSQLTPNAARQVLTSYVSKNVEPDFVKKIPNYNFTHILVYALGTKNINEVEPSVLEMAINDLVESDYGKKNAVSISPVIASLKITLAALKKDWSAMKSGSPVLVNLSGAILNMDLSGADLSSANLYLANLNSANLQGANLKNAYMFYTSLKWATLESANLKNAILANAFLNSANLKNADLTNSDLSHATLLGAALDNAKFTGVDMRNMRWETYHLYKVFNFILKNVDLKNTRWFGSSLINLNDQLQELDKKIKGHPNESECREAIALDLIRELQKMDNESAVNLLEEASQSPLFEHRSASSRVASSFAGVFKENAMPSHSKKILLDEKDRLIKLRKKK